MPEVMQRKGARMVKNGQGKNKQHMLQSLSQNLLEMPSNHDEEMCVCYQLQIPADMTLNEMQQAIFEDQARELGLDNMKAQKLLEISHRNAQEHAKAHEQQVAAWGDEVRRDRELGGSAMESTLAYARAGLAKFDPDRKLYAVLQETGYANHPIVIRFLSAIGKAHAEDAVLLGSSAPTVLPRHERLYGKYNK